MAVVEDTTLARHLNVVELIKDRHLMEDFRRTVYITVNRKEDSGLVMDIEIERPTEADPRRIHHNLNVDTFQCTSPLANRATLTVVVEDHPVLTLICMDPVALPNKRDIDEAMMDHRMRVRVNKITLVSRRPDQIEQTVATPRSGERKRGNAVNAAEAETATEMIATGAVDLEATMNLLLCTMRHVVAAIGWQDKDTAATEINMIVTGIDDFNRISASFLDL